MELLKRATFVLLCIAGAASAQSYPDKPIRLVVPYPPGGGSDAVARILVPKLSELLGQPIVVENRSGASGNVGSAFVATSAADGYTLLFTNNSLVVNASLPTKPPYDVLKDFMGVAMPASSANVLAVHPSISVTTVDQFIALARSQPGKLNYSTCGSGTSQHFAGELLKRLAHIDMVHVPYRGCGPAVTDGLGGQVPVLFNTISNTMPHHRAGKLRILGVASQKRSEVDSKIPTVAEAGFAGYEAEAWYGMFAPASTSREVVAKLNTAVNRVTAMRDVQERFRNSLFDLRSATPEELDARVRSDFERWSRLVVDVNMKID
jgi:tripartite-type tricarboxylate transporter receptor subunit TctC